MHAGRQTVVLSSSWKWKERDNKLVNVLEELSSEGWRPVHSGVPSEIHVELMHANLIPHPFEGFNEHKAQWVGEREWMYMTTLAFDKPSSIEFAELEFEGLDTFCSIYLDGELLLETNNQFRTYQVQLVPANLKNESSLLLHFKCAKDIALSEEAKYGRVRAGSCNLGHPSRVYVRKAQYDWRWDWGPELLTAGPYRPISLFTYTARISDLNSQAVVSASLLPSLAVELALRGNVKSVADVTVALRTRSGRIIKEQTINGHQLFPGPNASAELVSWSFGMSEVQLWWPTGYGTQELYEVEVTLLGENSSILDRQTKKVGFRRVRLIQESFTQADKYGKGTTFLFEINNVRMFIGGSNWVPGDAFLTTVTPERYGAWLQLVKDGNQNMVRLWGGGVYEPDIFYEICDELGLLVWQDFQFACGIYPGHEDFVANVEMEAEDNVRRLRHHPCMALFCGNNEDYQQILQWDVETDFPARRIYEEVLPKVVSSFTKDEVPYHRGSPYGGKGWDTADPTVGDVHQWNVWAGTRVYHDYDILGGRFVSEFGMPSMPDMRTVNHWLRDTPESERYAQSKIMAQHDKAGSHERRFAFCLGDNFRYTSELETHVYNTQMLQSDAMGYAYRMWRREWRGPGKEYTSGAIVWQINDSWPVTSWAIVDYFKRPKPAYYAIARELKQCSVGIFREVKKSRECDRPRQFYDFNTFPCVSATVEIWATNSALSERDAVLELSFEDLESDWQTTETRKVTLVANQTTEILSMDIPEPPFVKASSFSADLIQWQPKRTRTHTVVVGVKLLDAQSGEVLSRAADWPQPYRYYSPPDPGLNIVVQGEMITVSAQRPVKGLVFSVREEENVRWSDNEVDIMPGDPQVIKATGLHGKKLCIAHLGKERAREI
ncbi:hypothetical protein ACEPAI_782 [Sanghuangporus weigelae]